MATRFIKILVTTLTLKCNLLLILNNGNLNLCIFNFVFTILFLVSRGPPWPIADYTFYPVSATGIKSNHYLNYNCVKLPFDLSRNCVKGVSLSRFKTKQGFSSLILYKSGFLEILWLRIGLLLKTSSEKPTKWAAVEVFGTFRNWA